MYQLSEKQRQKIARRKERIVILCESGYSRNEIAKELSLSLVTVDSTVKELIQEGKISSKPIRPSSHQSVSSVEDLNCERVQKIISLKKQYATLKEIGIALGGLTRERVRQIVECIIVKHGEQVLIPDGQLWTIRKASQKFGVCSTSFIRSLCVKGKIPCRRRCGLDGTGAYILTSESIKTLKVVLEQFAKESNKRCVICKRRFVCKVFPKKLTCSEVCSQENRRRNNRIIKERLFEKEPTLDSLSGWQRELLKKLQSHKLSIKKREQWLTISKASKMTKLSKTQIWYLGKRHIITICNHPTKRWRRRSVVLYSVSEMEVVRQVYAEYLNG